MIIKFIIVLLTLLNQDNVLVKQGDVSVTLDDMDAYIYSIPEDKRLDFVLNKGQLEQSVLSLLNLNITYEYILNSEYKDDELFTTLINDMNNQELVLDSGYINKLDLDEKSFTENFKLYLLKKSYIQNLRAVLAKNIKQEALTKKAKENFLIEKHKYIKPEKRKISVILLNKENYTEEQAVNILKSILNDKERTFASYALEYSDDDTVDLNEGNWHEYTKENFPYPFKDKVFNASVGVIPTLFAYQGNIYIIKVNHITPKVLPEFENYKDDYVDKILSNHIDIKLQNIINTVSHKKAQVNPELAAHIFERYKVVSEN